MFKMFILPIREKLTSMILHIPLVEDINLLTTWLDDVPILEIVPIVGHRLVCEDEQMFSSVEDVELGEVEHVAGILLDDSEVIDGHLELLLGLCNLLPLQDGARPELGRLLKKKIKIRTFNIK